MNLEFKEEILLKKYMPNKSHIEGLSRFFYAFSDATRLRVVILLLMKPLCVSDIAEMLNINQTTISHQLKILKSLKLVDYDRTGKNIIYYISNSNIEQVFNSSINCI